MDLLKNPINKITPAIINIAKQYKEADPMGDSKTRKVYKTLARKLHNRARKIESKMNVVYSENDFYKNSQEMFKDIKENNRVFIFKGGEKHPVWSHTDNEAFRLVHDIDGHNLQHAFNLKGELATVKNMAKTINATPEESQALFAEIVGQFAYVLVYNKGKEYAPQKATLIKYNY